MPDNKEVEFLKVYLKRLQENYQILSELAPWEIQLPENTSEDTEHAARIADGNGFDGNIFRNLFPLRLSNELECWLLRQRLKKQIKIIPRIIAKIEKPVDRSLIPSDAELLTVPQVARLLNCGESVVRERDKKGLLPLSVRVGGTIQWRKTELKEWIAVGCPARQKWEFLKQGKAVA